MVAVPAVGATRPSSIRRVVVLPAPLGPRKPATVPWSIWKSSWSTASTSPKRLLSPCTLIAAMARLLPEPVTPTTLRARPAAVVGPAAALAGRPGGAGGAGRRPGGAAGGSGGAGGDQAGLVGQHHQLGPVAGLELGQDPADVGLGGGRAHHQQPGDLGGGPAPGHQGQHLPLPVGERGQRGRGDRAGLGPAAPFKTYRTAP